MNILSTIQCALGIAPSWKKCRRASCWNGPNAARRMMNILSPGFSDAKFREYWKWMKKRGCDTAHVFLVNQRDGECAGQNCATNPAHARLALRRIKTLRRQGFAVVPWIVADDSSEWARDLFANADARMKTLADAGLFRHASYVVLGLEMDEYGNVSQWGVLRNALARRWRGRVGVHHTSGNAFKFAHLGDIVLGQLDPKAANAKTVAAQIAAIRSMGKAAVGFEYARQPARDLAQAALDAGAGGVGNW